MKGSNEILGGYNPIIWKSDLGWGTTKDSFIFSFNNEDHILSRVMDENKAIINSSYYGPSFGSHDLIIWGDINRIYGVYCLSSKNSYEKPIRKTSDYFTLEECEIFQIV